MSESTIAKTIKHYIGTDKSIRFLIKRFDLTTKTFETLDLTGAYIYFEIHRTVGGVVALSKDNDPGGVNVGVTLLNQLTNEGEVDVKIEHTDLAAESPSDEMEYTLLIRLDPTGADDRLPGPCGAFQLKAAKVTVP